MKEIELTKGMVAIVDDEDYEKLNQYSWCMSGNYAARGTQKAGEPYRIVYMHQEIMGIDPALQGTVTNRRSEHVDHINGQPLDNRKSNLRIVTNQNNAFNRRKKEGTSSIYKGVSWRGDASKWIALIRWRTDKQNRRHLGYFESEKAAALAYNKAAVELFGEYAKLNMI